jgi:hypothetical protein
MRVALDIVISIVIILGMIVEANAALRVHAEYIRRRQAQGQSGFNIFHELPTGVHAEYIRRRVHGRSAVKPHHEVPAREHRRQPIPHVRQMNPHVRPHLRQQRINVINNLK